MTITPSEIPTAKPIFAPVLSPGLLLLAGGRETGEVAAASDALGVDPEVAKAELKPEADFELVLELKAVTVDSAELPSKLYPFICTARIS